MPDDSLDGQMANAALADGEDGPDGVAMESEDDGYEEDGEWSSDDAAERRVTERRTRRRRRRTSGGTPIASVPSSSSQCIPVPRPLALDAGTEHCPPGGSPKWKVLTSSPVEPGIVDRLSKHPSKRFTGLQQPRRAGGTSRGGEQTSSPDAGLSSIREAPDADPEPSPSPFTPQEPRTPEPRAVPGPPPGGRPVEPLAFRARSELDDEFQPFLEVRLQDGESGLFLRICRKLKTICDTKLAGAAERQKLRAP